MPDSGGFSCSEGNDGMRIGVMSQMLRASNTPQVFDLVVSAILIDVMHVIAVWHRPMMMSPHHTM